MSVAATRVSGWWRPPADLVSTVYDDHDTCASATRAAPHGLRTVRSVPVPEANSTTTATPDSAMAMPTTLRAERRSPRSTPASSAVIAGPSATTRPAIAGD